MKNLVYTPFLFLLLQALALNGFAQERPSLVLSLDKAIQTGLAADKRIRSVQLQTAVAATRQAEAAEAKIPDVNFHTSYARITNLDQYESGLTKSSTAYPSIPDIYDFTLNASVPLYAGGKIRNEEKKLQAATQLSRLNEGKTAKDVKLEIISSYLQIYHLMEQKALLADNIAEDSARIRQVQSLRNHGAVTKNELLRSQLQLSHHQLTATTINNDIDIALNHLKTMLEIPEETNLAIDTAHLAQEGFAVPDLEESMTTALKEKEELKMAKEEEKIRQLDKKQAVGNYYPTVALAGSYGLNYPNYKFFPPEPYAYRFGFIGVDVSFGLTNLLKNKKKVTVADQNIRLQQLRTGMEQDAVKDAVYAAWKKYGEALHRIEISTQAIQQAAENYRIVKSKYANQLALITDLMDADNSLLEARSSGISARIDARLKYYQLQYAKGTL